MSGLGARVEGEARMSLGEHLSELRSRLLVCVLSVLVFGGVALVFSRELFGLLMAPVLAALPPAGRSLVYTSGIEEINVLMKVGLYAGVFFTTPIILWQLWGFVSPGLLASERKFAGPFVLSGSASFLLGAVFCYLVLLPTMFQFLLNEPAAVSLKARLDRALALEEEALRYFRIGEFSRAEEVAKKAHAGLVAPGEGQVEGVSAVRSDAEGRSRMEGLGRMVDAASAAAAAPTRAVLRQVLDRRQTALEALATGDLTQAGQSLDEGASLLAGVSQAAGAIGDLWKLEKELALGRDELAQKNWTKPMLTMSEQLGLVLLLELAFGIIFELPVVMALLAFLGLVRASFLVKYQRHAIVVCLVAAAIITPTGDAVNLALMAVPMVLCYEVGVLAAYWIERRRTRLAPGGSKAPVQPA